MEVILKSDVEGLGKALDLVKVKSGYAQNYLFPKQLATLATPRNKEILEKDRAVAEEFYLKEKKAAEESAEKLKDQSVTIAAKTSEGEKLYGSVTAKDIVLKLKESGFEVERKQIKLSEPIKSLGMYTVKIHLPPDVETKIKVWVISDESEHVKD
jgi:large subunit ribosomal protein L9